MPSRGSGLRGCRDDRGARSFVGRVELRRAGERALPVRPRFAVAYGGRRQHLDQRPTGLRRGAGHRRLACVRSGIGRSGFADTVSDDEAIADRDGDRVSVAIALIDGDFATDANCFVDADAHGVGIANDCANELTVAVTDGRGRRNVERWRLRASRHRRMARRRSDHRRIRDGAGDAASRLSRVARRARDGVSSRVSPEEASTSRSIGGTVPAEVKRPYVAAAVLALTLAATGQAAAASLAAPTAVSTQVQLRGHLPDLGATPSIRLFASAAEYDAFHKSLGDADIFPPSGALFSNFGHDILALYARGADIGNRCITSVGSSSVSAGVVSLNLGWQDGTCGAPAGARYPFVLVSLSRTANDGTAWLSQLQSVCGSAPGVDGSRVCAPVPAGGAVSPSPTSATTTPQPSAPAPSATAITRTPAPTIAVGDPPIETPSGTITLLGWLGFGLIFGVFIAALFTRLRRAERTAKLDEEGRVG